MSFWVYLRNVNYKANNAEYYKTDNTVSEFYGALGFKSELGLFKLANDDKLNILKPKILFKISLMIRGIYFLLNPTTLNFANLFF